MCPSPYNIETSDVEHVKHVGDMKDAYRILVGNSEGNILLGGLTVDKMIMFK